jgi:hypothetical protein
MTGNVVKGHSILWLLRLRMTGNAVKGHSILWLFRLRMAGNAVKHREISSARRLIVSKCYSFPFENLMCPVSNV